MQDNEMNLGRGILKPGARPIEVHVDDQGEYWLCDAAASPERGEFRSLGCVAHSDIPMAEGG